MNMETLEESYDFYIEHCVDEEKGEIPLNFEEWKENHGGDERMKMTTAERNELKRQYEALVDAEGPLAAGHGWDEEEVLRHMREHCTVAEKYGTIANNQGKIYRTTVLQFHDRQDMIDFYEHEMLLKEDIKVDYRLYAHIDKMIIEIEKHVNFLDNVDAIKAYYHEGDDEE
jgi:predicted ATPase